MNGTNLKRFLEVKFRVTPEEYEYLSRLSNNTTIAKVIRKKIYTSGWEKRLTDLKIAQAHEPECKFAHPQTKDQCPYD